MKKGVATCLIEDDPANIYWMKHMLSEIDFCESLVIYNHGKEALDGLKLIIASDENIPKVIFLDLNMPVMDGWEFLDEFTLVPTKNKIFIYIVTSSINPTDVIKAQQYERVSDYIVKTGNKRGSSGNIVRNVNFYLSK